MNHSAEVIDQREVWYESAGTRLYAVERGRGLPLLHLHGAMADHRGSLFRIGALTTSYRLIAPDVRAAGRSHFTGALSWDLLADDVAALMRHLGLERAVIGGASFGSGIALKFAQRYPERTAALLLVWPCYFGAELGLNEAQRVAFERMREAGQRAAQEGIQAIFPLFAGLPDEIRKLATDFASRFDPASVAATTRFLASGAQPFERLAELGAVSTPTLVIPGLDAEHPSELANLYAQALPSCVLEKPTLDLVNVIASYLGDLR